MTTDAGIGVVVGRPAADSLLLEVLLSVDVKTEAIVAEVRSSFVVIVAVEADLEVDDTVVGAAVVEDTVVATASVVEDEELVVDVEVAVEVAASAWTVE